MGGGKGGLVTGLSETDQRFKKLEEKLDRLEKLLDRLQAERSHEQLQKSVDKALERPPK